jgi:hypothetical protein
MPGEPEIIEHIADILSQSVDHPQLLVRVYPKDQSGRFTELKKKRPDVLFPDIPWQATWLTPKFDDSYLLTNMLKHAAVGINVASTMSLELCMFDKPVINVGYNPPGLDIGPVDYRRYYDFDHYRPIVSSGAVRLARSRDEMRTMILESLRDPSSGSCARRQLINEMFGPYLEGSAERVAACIGRLANRRESTFSLMST